jgi:hypothetical protein
MSKKDLTTALIRLSFIEDLHVQRLDQDLMRGYLRELNISDIDVGSSRLDLYKLSGPFLDFFLFFDRTLNNHSSSGSSTEVRGTGRATEEQGAKENPYLSSTRGSCDNDSASTTA